MTALHKPGILRTSGGAIKFGYGLIGEENDFFAGGAEQELLLALRKKLTANVTIRGACVLPAAIPAAAMAAWGKTGGLSTGGRAKTTVQGIIIVLVDVAAFVTYGKMYLIYNDIFFGIVEEIIGMSVRHGALP